MPSKVVHFRMDIDQFDRFEAKVKDNADTISDVLRTFCEDYIASTDIDDAPAQAENLPWWQTNPVTVKDYELRIRDAQAALNQANDELNQANAKLIAAQEKVAEMQAAKTKAIREYSDVWEANEKRKRESYEYELADA